MDLLKELSVILRRLGPAEIRALGTHWDASKTVEDIDREFQYLNKWVWKDLLARLAEGSGFSDPAEQLLEYADEAWRKASRNRKAYKDGRCIVLQECSDGELNTAFANCQPDDSAIWDNQEVVRQAARARRLLAAAMYVVALAHFQVHPKERSVRVQSGHRKLRENWEHGWSELSACGLAEGLSKEPAVAFDGNAGEIKASVKSQLAAVLTQLRDE
jgi:hypothetical protein